MPQTALASEIQPLSQAARVAGAFVAPSKTFHDIPRSAAWWLPFVIVLLF